MARCPWKALGDSGCQWHILANLGAPDLQAPSRSGCQQTAGPPRPCSMPVFKVGRARRHRAHGAHGRSAARGSRQMDEGEAPCAPRASNAGLRRMAHAQSSRGPWIHSQCMYTNSTCVPRVHQDKGVALGSTESAPAKHIPSANRVVTGVVSLSLRYTEGNGEASPFPCATRGLLPARISRLRAP